MYSKAICAGLIGGVFIHENIFIFEKVTEEKQKGTVFFKFSKNSYFGKCPVHLSIVRNINI